MAEAVAAKVRADWSSVCTGSRMPIGGTLSTEDQQTLQDWADGGAPE